MGDCGISQTWQARAEGRVRTPSSGRGRKGDGAMPRTAPPGGEGRHTGWPVLLRVKKRKVGRKEEEV